MAESIYESAGGADGMLRLAEAWHQRVLAGPVVSQAFSHGFREDHTERLAACLGEALTGCGLTDEPRLAAALHEYFGDGIRRMSEHDRSDTVPEGLPLEVWTWDSSGSDDHTS